MIGREPRVIARTARQLLREITVADAPFMVEMNEDPVVKQFTGDDPFVSLEAAQKYFAEYDPYTTEGVGRWASIDLTSGEFLGWCGLRRVGGELDLGYRYMARARGKGLATEASRPCLAFAFETLGEASVVARVFPGNAASMRVMDKLGMRYECNVMSGTHDVLQYRILADEWRALLA